MNINARIRRYHQRRRPAVPAWAELVKLTDDQVAELARRLDIEPDGRMATLSAIHQARG